MQRSFSQTRAYGLPAAAVLMFSLFFSGPLFAASLTISGTPKATATVDQYYSWKPTTAGRDPVRLRFSITGKPVWATLSRYSGTLYGVPRTANIGTYSNIVISVTDGTTTVRLPAFKIVVAKPGSAGGSGGTNSAPTISGTPSTQVLAGSAYSFRPTASDTNGDTLTFSIANKPSWASFSTSSGALTGTPSASYVGTYSSVKITVSDGKGGSASLAAFNIAVVQTATGSATVRWTPPTTTTGGGALSNLSGYRILYGTTRGGPYASSVTITNPSVSTYVVSDLVPATYYFVVTARTSTGAESAYSMEASKSIQ